MKKLANLFDSAQSDLDFNDFNSFNEDYMKEFFGKLTTKNVFGKNLDPHDPSTIPPIINELMDYILKAQKVQGIFRKPGAQSRIEIFVKKVEKNKKYDLEKDIAVVHDAASVLKLWFRELEEPIIPKECISKQLKKEVIENDSLSMDSKEKLKLIMKSFPKTHIILLKNLCIFLNDFSKFENQTQMDLDNLSIIWAPNIVKSADDEILRAMNQFAYMADFKWLSPLFHAVLKNYRYLFDLKPKKPKIPPRRLPKY